MIRASSVSSAAQSCFAALPSRWAIRHSSCGVVRIDRFRASVLAILASVCVLPYGFASAGTLELSLNADTGVTFSSGTSIASWADQSGMGNSATRTGAPGTAPTLVTGAINGHDAVNFAATGTGGTIQTLVAPFTSAVAQTITVFVVGQIVGDNGASSGDYLFDGVGGSNRVAVALFATHEVGMYAGSGPITSTAQYNTGYHVYEAVFSGGTSQLYQDGTSVLSGDAGANGIGTNGLILGMRDSPVTSA